MKGKNIKSGISMIVLVITIIVIIVLATAVILTLANNNPIENAKVATNLNNKAAIEEAVRLAAMSAFTDGKGKIENQKSFDTLNNELKKIERI